MKSFLPFLTIAFFFASCSSVYKSGQTPDDVYFSPARPDRPQDEYARTENRDSRMYGDDYVPLEDRYLRMKTRNRRYIFLDNDYDCLCYGNNYNSYSDYYRLNNYYGYTNNWWMLNGGYGKYYNPYYANIYSYNPYYYNPYYGNPYYSGVVYGNVNPVYNRPRRGNLQTYNNGNIYGESSPRNNRKINFDTYQSNDNNYRGSNKNAGSFLRNVFGSGNSSNNSSTTTSQPSSTNSSSSGSSSSSRAPVRKF